MDHAALQNSDLTKIKTQKNLGFKKNLFCYTDINKGS